MALANAVYQSYVYADGDKIHRMTEKDIEAMDSGPQSAEVEMSKPADEYAPVPVVEARVQDAGDAEI